MPEMIKILVYLVAALILLAAAWYALDNLAPSPTIIKFGRVVLVVLSAVAVAMILLGAIGYQVWR